MCEALIGILPTTQPNWIVLGSDNQLRPRACWVGRGQTYSCSYTPRFLDAVAPDDGCHLKFSTRSLLLVHMVCIHNHASMACTLLVYSINFQFQRTGPTRSDKFGLNNPALTFFFFFAVCKLHLQILAFGTSHTTFHRQEVFHHAVNTRQLARLKHLWHVQIFTTITSKWQADLLPQCLKR